MEFSAKVTRIGQALLAVFMAVAGAVMWLESRSNLAAAIRAGQPYLCWLEFGSILENPSYALAIYQPGRRMFDLVHVIPPGEYRPISSGFELRTALQMRKRVEDAEGSLLANIPLTKVEAPLPMIFVPDGTEGRYVGELSKYKDRTLVGTSPDIAVDEMETLRARTQGLRFWREWPQQLRRLIASQSTMPLIDRLLLAVELHRMPPENLRAAWLPDDEDHQRFFFGNIFAPPSETRSSGRAIAVEVLNATRTPGIASTATDVLRLHGADVVNVGNAPEFRDRTVIYDRTGRAENAEAVRDFLGCRQARVVTQISPKKLVDVTVALAEDCASAEQRGTKWNWLKF